MHRCLAVSAAAIIAIGLCCGCNSATKPSVEDLGATIAVVPVSALAPPGPKLVNGQANVVGAAEESVPFTLELPPGWIWTAGQAEKTIGPPLTVLVSLTARELPDDEKRERPSAAARRRLLELGDDRLSDGLAASEKLIIRDRRIIQIDGNDAVWDVVAIHADGQTQPTRLEARCHLKLGHQEFTIEGSHIDSRTDRTAADFDESQAEFLKITQSFRLDRNAATPLP